MATSAPKEEEPITSSFRPLVVTFRKSFISPIPNETPVIRVFYHNRSIGNLFFYYKQSICSWYAISDDRYGRWSIFQPEDVFFNKRR